MIIDRTTVIYFSFASDSKNLVENIFTANVSNAKYLQSIPNEKEESGHSVSFYKFIPRYLLFC